MKYLNVDPINTGMITKIKTCKIRFRTGRVTVIDWFRKVVNAKLR